jgi:hypothetical protein
MNILEKRNRKRHSLLNEIKDIEKSISRSKEASSRIQSSGFDFEYIQKETTTLSNLINEKEKRLEEINSKLLLISSGELDVEIENEYVQNKQQIDVKTKKTKEKKVKESEDSQKNKKVSKQYSDNIYNDKQIYKQTERDIKYAYNYFCKIIDSLPDYMKKKLSEMPNNKGYYWRGVCFYGKLEDDNSNTSVLFEKSKGNVLFIHEYTRDEYIKYEKVGNNRKKLLFRRPKIAKDKEFSLFDYVKK